MQNKVKCMYTQRCNKHSNLTALKVTFDTGQRFSVQYNPDNGKEELVQALLSLADEIDTKAVPHEIKCCYKDSHNNCGLSEVLKFPSNCNSIGVCEGENSSCTRFKPKES